MARRAAETIVAEIGINMSRVLSMDRLVSWAAVAPGNNESAGKRHSSQVRKWNQVLRGIWVQAAHAAAHTRQAQLAAQYRRLAARGGKKKAILAVPRSILAIGYHLT